MTDRKRMMMVEGQMRETTAIGFRPSVENFNDYLLDDGTVARLKSVVTEVHRVDGQFDADGNPLYLFKSAIVTSVSAPAHLREDAE